MKNYTRRGQVWIETVLYTLIGIVLIGIVLSFVMPKINATKDKVLVEQSIEVLNAIDEKINSVLQASDNVRKVEISIKKGEIYFDSLNERIIFVINDLSSAYSEPGIVIQNGRVKIISYDNPKNFGVNLTLDYSYNITYNDNDEFKKFSPSSIPYEIYIKNQQGRIIISEEI